MGAIRTGTFGTNHCPNLCPIPGPEEGRSVPVISEVTERKASLQPSASTEGGSLPFEPPRKAASLPFLKEKKRKEKRKNEPTDEALSCRMLRVPTERCRRLFLSEIRGLLQRFTAVSPHRTPAEPSSRTGRTCCGRPPRESTLPAGSKCGVRSATNGNKAAKKKVRESRNINGNPRNHRRRQARKQ